MIDRFARVARGLGFLAVPALLIALTCLAGTLYLLFSSTSAADDRYLLPGMLGMLWALSAYGFIATFRHAPLVSQATTGGPAQRLTRRLKRAWYWLVAGTLFAASLAGLALTIRLLLVWSQRYAA